TAGAWSNPVARAEWLHVQTKDDYGFGIGLAWTPPQPGVYGPHRDAARATEQAVTADISERAADLEQQVRSAYAQIQALDQELELAAQSVAMRRAVYDATSERVVRGAGSRIDVSLAAVSVARGEQQRELLQL